LWKLCFSRDHIEPNTDKFCPFLPSVSVDANAGMHVKQMKADEESQNVKKWSKGMGSLKTGSKLQTIGLKVKRQVKTDGFADGLMVII
jgi:hypothetical protein